MTGLTNPKFDYDAIDKQEAAKLRYYEGELDKSKRRVAAEVIKHGEILRGAQEVLANHHEGVFGSWLDSLGISRRSAYNAISAFEAFGDSCANLHNLEVSAMYELAKNEDAKKRALKLADKGVRITHEMAKAILEDIAEKQEAKPTKREPAKPAPAIEPHIAALDGETIDISPAQPVVDSAPADKCPNCAAVKWTRDGDSWACGKCHHPYGEPAGEPDSKRINEARALAVKYAEALMRAVDDLNHLVPNRGKHDEVHGLYTQIWEMVKSWR